MSGRPGLARNLTVAAGVLVVVAANALLLEGVRRRHPDRARYSIAAGEIELALAAAEESRPAHLGGTVRRLEISELHVPFPLRRSYDALIAEMKGQSALPDNRPPPPPRFRATVAWGERLEPWLVDLAPGAPVASAPAPTPAR